MKFLTNMAQLHGRTIARVFKFDYGRMAIVFTDNSYAFLGTDTFSDSYDINLIEESSGYLERKAGLISEDEYILIKEEREVRAKAEETIREKRLLASLKKKYEGKND